LYEDIVRKSLDPALLEMADYRTFRARIFPTPPKATRRLTLRYDATLPIEGKTVTFQYPMQGALSHRGAGAVQMSKSIRAMKSAEVASEAEPKRVGLVSIQGNTLRQQADGTWMDIDYKTEIATIKLAFASEAYFTFLRVFPEAREFCKPGSKVIFKFRGKFVQIGDSGEKQMTKTRWREIFR
jgi:hypothetical protein